jgi:DNA polymerase-3 subunit epsilon
VEDARLIIHNAPFDMAFLNAELKRAERKLLSSENVIDTLALARRKHPGSNNTLDALCRRYGVDNSGRTKHGALLDSELLADVYLKLIGAEQAGLDLAVASSREAVEAAVTLAERTYALKPRLTEEEKTAHTSFIEKLGAGALWRKYWV